MGQSCLKAHLPFQFFSFIAQDWLILALKWPDLLNKVPEGKKREGGALSILNSIKN